MRTQSHLVFVIVLSLPFGCVFAKTHTLQKGETLASVARKYYGEPVFGPKGTIKKLYKLNPWAEKNPNTVGTGQEIVVEESIARVETPSAVPAVPVPPPSPAMMLPPTPPAAPMIDGPAVAAEVKKSWDQKKIEDANAAVAAAETATQEDSAHAHDSMSEKKESRGQYKVAKSNEFYLVPYYSMSTISLQNPTSGVTYDLSSAGAFGARLGWSRKFNASFSTLIEANTMMWSSGATNTTTAAKVADRVNLYEVDLVLMNQIGEKSMFGIGFSYGNKLFVENFDATPANESVATFTSLNPVVVAKLSLYDSGSLGIPLTLKWAPLPADLDKGVAPGIKAGNEFTARLMLAHKLTDSEITYGLSYKTNDQAENGRTQKRTDTNVEFGMVF